MANADIRSGLRPVGEQDGRVRPYYVPASYATALFRGDPVVKTGTSNTAGVTMPGAGHFPAGTLPEINKATAGSTNPVTGVIVGFAPNPDALGRTHNTASTEAIAYVCDDPDMIFEVQCSAGMAETDVGLNGNLVYTHSGDAINGTSGAELSSGALATTAAHQLKVLRIVNRGDVETGTNAKVLVRINNHTEAHAVAGI